MRCLTKCFLSAGQSAPILIFHASSREAKLIKKLNVSGWPSPRARLFVVVVANWPGIGFMGFSLVFELLDTGSFPLHLTA